MNDYPPDWNDIAREIKDDADDRCIRCGHPNESPIRRVDCDDTCSHDLDGKQRVLTVHHLDGDKANNRWWNLAALCQVCHLKVQARFDPNQDQMFELPDWLQCHMAGYYAYHVYGLHLTKTEVEVMIPELLAVGQPWIYTDLYEMIDGRPRNRMSV